MRIKGMDDEEQIFFSSLRQRMLKAQCEIRRSMLFHGRHFNQPAFLDFCFAGSEEGPRFDITL